MYNKKIRLVISGPMTKHLLKRMVIKLFTLWILWINGFYIKWVVSTKYTPHTLLTAKIIDFTKIFKPTFGSYYKVNKDPNPSNGNNYRTSPAICIWPTFNLHRSYKLLNLIMERWVHQKKDWYTHASSDYKRDGGHWFMQPPIHNINLWKYCSKPFIDYLQPGYYESNIVWLVGVYAQIQKVHTGV